MTYFIFGLICFRFLVIVCRVLSVPFHFKMCTALQVVSSDFKSILNTVSFSPEFLLVPNFKFRMHLFAVSFFSLQISHLPEEADRKRRDEKEKPAIPEQINIYTKSIQISDFIWFHLNSFLTCAHSVLFCLNIGLDHDICAHIQHSAKKEKTHEIFFWCLFLPLFKRKTNETKTRRNISNERCGCRNERISFQSFELLLSVCQTEL